MIRMRKTLPFLVLALSFLSFSLSVNAATEKSGGSVSAPQTLLAPEKKLEEEETGSYIYERPTIEKLSQLYWALGNFDGTDDKSIDNFLMINECDIYRDYISNEFEWSKIRENARAYLAANRRKFPLRFEMSQPIKLGKYNLETESFEIPREFEIKGVRQFEIRAENFFSTVCGFDPEGRGYNIDGYPRALLVEIGRPITLDSLPVKPDTAKRYIDRTSKAIKGAEASRQSEESLAEIRDAYIFMKLKFFNFRGVVKSSEASTDLARVMAILEGIEIYADPKKSLLLYSENYRSKSNPGRKSLHDDPAQERRIPNPNPNKANSAPAQENAPSERGIPEYNPSLFAE